MKPGFKRYLCIVSAAWCASWLVTPALRMETELGSFIQTLVEALPAGLLVGTIAWALSRKAPAEDFKLLSSPVFWSIIVVGLLAFGRTYGAARDSGMEIGAANLQAIVGLPGILIAFGIIGLILSRPKAQKSENAPNK